MFPISLKRVAISFAMFVAVILGSSVLANATPVVFQLTNGNPGLNACAGCTGPYATVTVSQTSATTATISFQGLTQGTNIYLFGGQGIVGLNFNGGPVTVSGNPPSTSLGGAANEDGFGLFNFTLDNTDGFNDALSSLSFNVTCLSCNWLADSSNVLTPNADGNSVAAHIFVSCAGCTAARATGYATNGSNPSTEQTPEPATMLLLGTGLAGLATGLRKRHKSLRRN